MSYGNCCYTETTEDINGVWDVNYKGVWHLKESGADILDSTGNYNDGTSYGTTQITGKIWKAQDFDTNDYIDLGGVYNGIKTVSFWIKADSTTEDIIDLNGTVTITVLAGTIQANNFTSPTIYVDGIVSSTIDTDWHYVVITTATGINVNNCDLGRISSSYFNGILDEIRLSNSVRFADWIKTKYNSQNSPTTFYAIGTEYGTLSGTSTTTTTSSSSSTTTTTSSSSSTTTTSSSTTTTFSTTTSSSSSTTTTTYNLLETGLQSPASTGDDYTDWSSPTDAYTSNDTHAKEDITGNQQDWYDFSFGLPGGATILGIEVLIEGNNNNKTTGCDVELSWDGGANYTTSGYGAIWPLSSTDSTDTFGGSEDGWGRVWSDTELSNANFRVRLTKDQAVGSDDFNVDHIQINIHYHN